MIDVIDKYVFRQGSFQPDYLIKSAHEPDVSYFLPLYRYREARSFTGCETGWCNSHYFIDSHGRPSYVHTSQKQILVTIERITNRRQK
jgi:hypothetical protein